MTHDQQTRLLTLAHDCAMLTVELQNDRRHSTGFDKGRLRSVGNLLEQASRTLTRAVERMKQ